MDFGLFVSHSLEQVGFDQFLGLLLLHGEIVGLLVLLLIDISHPLSIMFFFR